MTTCEKEATVCKVYCTHGPVEPSSACWDGICDIVNRAALYDPENCHDVMRLLDL